MICTCCNTAAKRTITEYGMLSVFPSFFPLHFSAALSARVQLIKCNNHFCTHKTQLHSSQMLFRTYMWNSIVRMPIFAHSYHQSRSAMLVTCQFFVFFFSFFFLVSRSPHFITFGLCVIRAATQICERDSGSDRKSSENNK